MKRNIREGRDKELSSLNAKCDLIIELLEAVLDNPDFLIDRLRDSVERQHRSACPVPKMRIVRHETR